VAHETGQIRSGDVDLFYRVFRRGGNGVPLLLFHGANYYDSSDWIEVAERLAQDRDVVVHDIRGFGRSSWSADKDYSYDAHLADARAVLDRLGWDEVAVAGHSRGGLYALLFAARLAARCRAAILLDYCPPRSGASRAPGSTPVGQPRETFATVDEALTATSRSRSASAALERMRERLEALENRFALRRDPDWANLTPQRAGFRSQLDVTSLWDELARVTVPTLLVRCSRSDRCSDELVAALGREPLDLRVQQIDAGHDLAAEAPDALVSAVGAFLAAATAPHPSPSL
jgi:pimeloyl-ACP methyl ester carboxylesterase